CDPALFEEAEEKALYDAFQAAKGGVDAAIQAGDYRKALDVLTGLKPQIDTYFDEVLVMCEDEKLRLNRLRMLKEIDRAFRRIADFQQIVQ
ncbi:MAG: DALR anticodon-binding domain-containing protein, partial [Armatimonadota bacterium]